MDHIGKKIKARRVQLKLSQEDVATFMGLTQGAVSQWEVGAHGLAVDNLVKLAQILQTTVGDLLSETESQTPVAINEPMLAMAMSCLEKELGAKYEQLAPAQKTKLIVYIYNKGSALTKHELLPLIKLVS
jgi:transcriptional regulator with XRE-family HTH domain